MSRLRTRVSLALMSLPLMEWDEVILKEKQHKKLCLAEVEWLLIAVFFIQMKLFMDISTVILKLLIKFRELPALVVAY